MIVHILTAERFHLVPGIINGFLSTYSNDASYSFILLSNKNIDESRYIELFKKNNQKEYSFCYNKREFINKLWEYRKNTILLHGEMYLFLFMFYSFLFRINSANWVCWGWGAELKKPTTWRSSLFQSIKKTLYNRLDSIVTLMEDDRKSIIKDFHMNPNKVFTIPYASQGSLSKRDMICLKVRSEKRDIYEYTRILLGNNPGNIPYYHDLIDLLANYKEKLKIHCMLNYSLQKNNEYTRLLHHGKTIYGDNFFLDEDFYSDPEDYVRYMNSYDIYICGNPNQTGLGALYTMLELGKKIYVTGKNYSWLKNGLDAIVYNINEIKDYTTFVLPLSEVNREKNFHAVIDFKQKVPELWHTYLRQINHKSD